MLQQLLTCCSGNESTRIYDINMTYDANGNLISDGNFTYTYDNANRLTTVTNKTTDLIVAAFAYDENGKRVKKTKKRCDNFIYFRRI